MLGSLCGLGGLEAAVARRPRASLCRRQRVVQTRALGPPDEFGARDPTRQELDFGFQEKVQYNPDTDHVKMIPASARKYIGLASKKCTPCPPGTPPLLYKDAELRRKQVLDWKLVEDGATLRLRRTWSAKDASSGQELAARVRAVATEEDYAAAVHVTGETQMTVDLCDPALGGLSDNEFILAAKLDALALADLTVAAPKRRALYY